jgi:alcohol dehydrogenase (cytochrome c)
MGTNKRVLVTCSALVVVLTIAITLRPVHAADTTTTTTNYEPVTDQRLLQPADGDWLQYRRTYDGHGYSPLTQINSQNVKDLVPVWSFSTGVNAGHEGTPIVNSGIMYVTASYNKLYALDAKTGKLLWKYDHEIPEKALGTACCDVVNRGVALYGDKVYMGTLDARVVALDAKTGKVAWSQKVADYKEAYGITAAPIVVKGKIITGMAGGEFGVRGFLAALNADTGEIAWKTYTVPGPGEPGHDTWPADSDAWKHGGASTWTTGVYDADQNLIFWGTGNPGPWAGDVRPGANLYSVSVLGIDADTGKIRSHFQYVPHDLWDYDNITTPMLIDVERDGKTIHGLVSAHKHGYFYLLDRANNLQFIYGEPFAHVTVFKGLDAAGHPIVDPSKDPTNGQVEVCPSFLGGSNWMPLSYNPNTGYVYVPMNEWCETLKDLPGKYETGKAYVRAEFHMHTVPGNDYNGEVKAIDPKTGKTAWVRKFEDPIWAGTVATAGDLVFTGGTASRNFMALNAKTGDTLWEFRTNSGIVGVPTTYTVDGQQYVSIISGFGGAIPIWTGEINEKYTKDVPQGGVVWAFALKK